MRFERELGVADSLFAYGTLQFPQVLIHLLERCPALEPVAVSGWRAAALPGRVYPGLVPATDSVTPGVLLTGLTAAEWRILDAFEDDEYDLRTVEVHPGGRTAMTYVWTAPVSEQTWYSEEFAAAHLAAFVTRCARSKYR
ncbi:gamma-glutamylcyclotransferase family protein [Nocardia arthritidis]|uniref:Putative gamma-glutamylcyclotransferase n=1 Tax=Nocardia arthritidis TaxID=228602 RepID=A0A6G9YKT1_9NOCA|nr:gamma-glutamylcyclotransferase family protein [Nocardia arthritidis]QIS13798.1 gamma-glutamylcyclotransferase [Nocardia arthritidis]